MNLQLAKEHVFQLRRLERDRWQYKAIMLNQKPAIQVFDRRGRFICVLKIGEKNARTD